MQLEIENRTGGEKKWALKHGALLVMIGIMFLHLLFIYKMQTYAGIGGDGIFTYTLANNPYSFEYIDPAYKKFPQNNGWIDARILKESYVIEDYDDFNYSSVYFHQRIDNHPLLYYSLVHTVCSIFQGTYSNRYTMIINWIVLCTVDILIIKFMGKIYEKVYFAAVPFTFLFLMKVIQSLCVLPRMYMTLAFFCFWYLYIHWNLLANESYKKSCFLKMIVCIFLGSQVHYYFYVYAFSLTILTVVYFIYKKKIYELFNYFYSGIIGIATSWILFPWVIWHIFFNQMQKHTVIGGWSFEKLKKYMLFLNEQLFNGRGLVAAVIIAGIYFLIMILKRPAQEKKNIKLFRKIVFGSGVIYSLIIFTLDEDNWYYMTPLYLTFIIWFSMLLVSLIKRITAYVKAGIWVVVLSIICAVGIYSISPVISYWSGYLKSWKVKDDFCRIAEEYQGYDCIFVEKYQDNLLQGLWFEFGDYDEFKKIPVEEFEQNGISQEELSGRKSNSEIVIYAPLGSPDTQKYQLVENAEDYGIYKMIDGAAEQ